MSGKAELLTTRTDMVFMLFPGFGSRLELIGEITRSIWYFEPVREQTKTFYVLYAGTDVTQEDFDAMLADMGAHLAPYFDPVIADWAKEWIGKMELIQDPDRELETTWSTQTTGIMVWGAMTPSTWGKVRSIGDRTGIFYTNGDVHGQMNEGANRNLFTRKLLSEERLGEIRDRSEVGLRRLRDEVANRETYVYGSAPSVSQIIDAEYDFGDGVHIVCNSLIKNFELMDILNPKVVICGDPVFHGGPSRYAAEFRRTLSVFLDRYDAQLITPLDYVANFEAVLDEKHHDRIIGLLQTDEIDINLDLIDDPRLWSTENILTMMLLPVAFTLSDNVSILGCDGRSFVHDEYFWSHDKKSQFDDLMEETKLAHPAFFDRDFNAYFISHCDTLEKVLQKAESMDKRARLITPSYIPPLAKRYQAVI